MKITLHKYVFNEIWPIFLISLAVFAFIAVTAQMLTISEWVINRGVGIGQVIRLVLYLMPGIIHFSLPAAVLMAVLIGFLRLSSDNEILALKASGISLYQMLPAVFVVALASSLVALYLGLLGAPKGNKAFKDLIFQVAQSKGDLGIKERIFCEPFDGVTFYIHSFSPRDRVMKDVFLVDRREPRITSTIIAKEGRIVPHPKSRSITIGLLRGTIFMVDRDLDASRTIKFQTYDLNLGLKDMMAALALRKKAPKEMSTEELIDQLKKGTKGDADYNETLGELLEKFSIPLAVFFMALIGVPLGSQLKSTGRSVGIGVGLVIFLMYYLCLAAVRNICETGTLSPFIGVWLPDLFLFAACFYLLRRVANERPIGFVERITWRWRHKEDYESDIRGDDGLKIGVTEIRTVSGDRQDEAPRYIGNRRIAVYHRSDCKWAEKISAGDRMSFETREDALEQGYRPCKVCQP